MLDGDEFVALLPRFDEGHMEADFKFLGDHGDSLARTTLGGLTPARRTLYRVNCQDAFTLRFERMSSIPEMGKNAAQSIGHVPPILSRPCKIGSAVNEQQQEPMLVMQRNIFLNRSLLIRKNWLRPADGF
jgi:hypothetical protein